MLETQAEQWIKVNGGFRPHSKTQTGLGLAQVTSEGCISSGQLPTAHGNSAEGLHFWIVMPQVGAMRSCGSHASHSRGNHPDQQRKTTTVE
jgi:hypothetical protein